MSLNRLDKFQGALLGLACGDALGTTVEFSPRWRFEPLTDIVGGGPFNLKAGQWTDDTSMALCLAESLLVKKKMNLADQLERYLNWFHNGENSVTGDCFDIGNTVRAALNHFQRTGNSLAGSCSPSAAGNGSIMRLAPVVLFYANHPISTLLSQCEASSRTTHQAPEAIAACQLFGYYTHRALSSISKEEILNVDDFFEIRDKLSPSFPTSLKRIATGSYQTKTRDDIKGSGYVVDSLEAALWCFHQSETFEEGALLAANLGDDADTTAAVFGQLAGAYYGKQGIPKNWLRKLAWKNKIQGIADRLYESSSNHP